VRICRSGFYSTVDEVLWLLLLKGICDAVKASLLGMRVWFETERSCSCYCSIYIA